MTTLKEIDAQFDTDIMIVDIMGGDKLTSTRKNDKTELTAPGEILVMDGSGALSVRHEIDDADRYKANKFEKPQVFGGSGGEYGGDYGSADNPYGGNSGGRNSRRRGNRGAGGDGYGEGGGGGGGGLVPRNQRRRGGRAGGDGY